MKYRPEIDGLRAVAVLAVIMEHAKAPFTPGGFIGVDVFFVISGYLITTILLRETAEGRFSYRDFYERRARRILPALIVVMIASSIVAWSVMLPRQLDDYGKSVIATLAFGSNFYFWRYFDYFSQDAALMPMLHTWSLGVEEQFYILFPILMAAMATRRRALPAVLGALAAVSFGLAVAASTAAPAAAFYLLPFRAFELLIGAGAALAAPRLTGRGEGAAHAAAAAAGLAMILAAVALTTPQTPFPGFAALPPTLGAALIILFARPDRGVGRLLSAGPVVTVGLISYSAYLWHQPLLAFFRLRFPDLAATPAIWAVAALTLPLAWASWRWVEEPLRRPARTPLRPFVALIGGAGALVVAASAAMVLTDGFPKRLPPDATAAQQAFDRAFEARQRTIRAGVCHFNERGVARDLEGFLAAWDCADPAPGAIAVVGDSHSADKAVALRAAGAPVVQMGGASCRLSPERMLPRCRRQFDFLKARLAERGWRGTLVLSNRFEAEDLTPEAIDSMLDYWGETGAAIVVLGGMPEFPNLEAAVPAALLQGRAADWRTAGPAADMTRAARSDAPAVRERVAARGAAFVSVAESFCALSGPGRCGYVAPDGTLLLVDYGHLSPEGAALLGARLLPAIAAAAGGPG